MRLAKMRFNSYKRKMELEGRLGQILGVAEYRPECKALFTSWEGVEVFEQGPDGTTLGF